MGGNGKRTLNKQMAESMILAKLYKDGFLLVDEKNKKATVDMRKGEIIERYKESSYDDIKSILERTAAGLRTLGYHVKIRYLEGVSPEFEKTIDAIQEKSSEIVDQVQSALDGSLLEEEEE